MFARIGDEGKISIFSRSETDVLVDVNGFVPASSPVKSLVPARLLDTRPGQRTTDNRFQGFGPIAGGTALSLVVADRGGVPDGVQAVFLNVTVVEPVAMGFVTTFPSGADQPNASNLNYSTAQTVANSVFAQVGSDGRINIYTLATAHMIVDVNGFVPGN